MFLTMKMPTLLLDVVEDGSEEVLGDGVAGHGGQVVAVEGCPGVSERGRVLQRVADEELGCSRSRPRFRVDWLVRQDAGRSHVEARSCRVVDEIGENQRRRCPADLFLGRPAQRGAGGLPDFVRK